MNGTIYSVEQSSTLSRERNGIKAHRILEITEKGFIIPLPQGYPQKTTDARPGSFEVLKDELKVGDYLDFSLYPQSNNGTISSWRMEFKGITPPAFCPDNGKDIG